MSVFCCRFLESSERINVNVLDLSRARVVTRDHYGASTASSFATAQFRASQSNSLRAQKRQQRRVNCARVVHNYSLAIDIE